MSTCASHLSLRYLCSSFTFSGQESVARACSYAQRTQHFFGRFSSSQIWFFTSSSLLHWNANLGVALSHLQNEWLVYQLQPDHLSLENIWLGFPCNHSNCLNLLAITETTLAKQPNDDIERHSSELEVTQKQHHTNTTAHNHLSELVLISIGSNGATKARWQIENQN